MRKVSLNIFNSPISGATISITAAMVVYFPYLTFSGRIRKVSVNRRSVWFLFAGLCTDTTWVPYLTGLALGKVTIMAPINNGSNPSLSASTYLNPPERQREGKPPNCSRSHGNCLKSGSNITIQIRNRLLFCISPSSLAFSVLT